MSEEPHHGPSPFHDQSSEAGPGDLFVRAAEWKSDCVCVRVRVGMNEGSGGEVSGVSFRD